jgi:hypothetical protein
MNVSQSARAIGLAALLMGSLASVAVAQNTTDPQLFINGSARGCQGCDL